MPTALELYDGYLQELGGNYPECVPLMRAAFEAYDAIEEGRPVTRQLLQPIVEAASDSRKLLFEIPVDFLDQLTGKYEEARAAVVEMSEDPRTHTRFNAIMCIGKAAPLDFKLRLIRQGLRDKSSKVRWKAADWAGFRMGIRELLPELEEAVAQETNEKAKASIQWQVDFLRQQGNR